MSHFTVGRRFALLVVALSLGAVLAPVPTAPAWDGSVTACPGVEQIPGVGLGCRRSDGLLEVRAPDGALIGVTHGPDGTVGLEPPALDAAALDALPEPSCVEGRPGQFYALVIFARAFDDTDEYDAKVEAVRDTVRWSNMMVASAAAAVGANASLRVHCTDGEITVLEAVLPTSKARTNFGTILSDLRSMNLSSPRVKHWIYYDDTSGCWCLGMGTVSWDDKPIRENFNNGRGASYSVTFGYMSGYVMLHELGHNLGAVQISAPHTTGGWHCTDGWDVMCYPDGGPRAWEYNGGVCWPMKWDCNGDDYFNPRPANGSYLATHWNIGAPYVRFVDRGDGEAPNVTLVAPAPGQASAGCDPSDPGSWGVDAPDLDVSRSDVPQYREYEGPPRRTQYPWRVMMGAGAGPAFENPAREQGEPLAEGPAVSLGRVCVVARASDAESEVAAVVVRWNGDVRATILAPTARRVHYAAEIDLSDALPGIGELSVEAYDLSGNARTATRQVLVVRAPTVEAPELPAPPETPQPPIAPA